MKLKGAVATGTALGLAAVSTYAVLHTGHRASAPRPAVITTGMTCWARGQGVTIRTIGYPGACTDPGQWTGPVDGAPYLPAQAHTVHRLGAPACTVTASGTVWTIWATTDLLAALDVCSGDLGSTPPGEAP